MAVINTHSTDIELSSSQYWSITDASQTGLGITGDISIECWVNLEQLPSTAGSFFGLVTKFDADNVKGRAYQLLITTGDLVNFAFNSSNTNQTSVQTTSALFVSGDVGNWVHLAISADVSAGAAGITIYKNGTSVAVTTNLDNATSIQSTTADFGIGSRIKNSGADFFFDGKLDDVRVWNDVRTTAEIDDNKDNCDLSVSEAGLVSWWAFNNNALDETSNNNDLTNNNTATFVTDIPYTCAAAFTPTVIIY